MADIFQLIAGLGIEITEDPATGKVMLSAPGVIGKVPLADLINASDPEKGSALVGHESKTVRDWLENLRAMNSGIYMASVSGSSFNYPAASVGQKVVFITGTPDHDANIIFPDNAEMGMFLAYNASGARVVLGTETGGAAATLGAGHASFAIVAKTDNALFPGGGIIAANPTNSDSTQLTIDATEDADFFVDTHTTYFQQITFTDTGENLTGPKNVNYEQGVFSPRVTPAWQLVRNQTPVALTLKGKSSDPGIALAPGREVLIRNDNATELLHTLVKGLRKSVVSVTASRDAQASDIGAWIRVGGSGDIDYTLLNALSVGWQVGDEINMRMLFGPDSLTIVSGSGVTVNIPPGSVAIVSGTASQIKLVCVAVNYATGEVEFDASGDFQSAP